jgi:hypothetical protein
MYGCKIQSISSWVKFESECAADVCYIQGGGHVDRRQIAANREGISMY